eukprot:Nitzschia sp. Nitz4//scaffold40_size135432//120608//122946//NITZ4_003269-RA/size135432-processed-gene-0.53-mRNA-1//1//CDS//3329551294//3819//frame0
MGSLTSSKKLSHFLRCIYFLLVSSVLLATTIHSFAFSTPLLAHRQWVPQRNSPVTAAPAATSISPRVQSLKLSRPSVELQSPSYYDGYDVANTIAPQTKHLKESLLFFLRFAANYFSQNKIVPRPTGKRRAMWRKLNEQRKNIMSLAGYTPHLIIPSFTSLFFGAWMTSLVPAYVSKCIQCVSTLTASKSQLLEAVVGLALTSTLAAFLTGMRGSLFWIGGCRCNYNVRVKLHRSLLLQEAAFFDTNETGYLLSRLNSDVNKIGQVISYHVNVVMRQFAQFLFGSYYLIRISPKLSAWAFAGIGVVAWLSAVYGDFARDLAETVQNTFAEGTTVAETSFSMSKTVRAFNGAEIESQKYESGQSKALELEEVQAWAYGAHKFLSDTLQTILQAGLLLGCWSMGKAGGLPAAQLTTFMFYSSFVLESSNEVGDEWAKIQQAVGASSSVFDLIRRAPLIRDPPLSLQKRKASKVSQDGAAPVVTDSTSPVIAMKNVTLQYASMERPALSKVDLEVYPGDRVALVGSSGGGKSSMLRTMMRFYDPSCGSVFVCGEDLRDLTRAETASRVAVVEQEPQVFPLSVLENVLYGVEKDDMNPETGVPVYSESYRQAATESLALAGLPVDDEKGLGLSLETRIGEGGRSLSGGQRQRVAIARALVRHPEVLLLDEPTAALDTENEKRVLEALRTSMVNTKSMVMVTHRLGVIRALGVNRVIVMDEGVIVEDGHPEELMHKEDSPYAALAREQGITAKAVSAKR